MAKLNIKAKPDTTHREEIQAAFEKEIEKFQKKVDQLYSYKKIKRSILLHNVSSFPNGYELTDNDYVLINFQIAFKVDKNQKVGSQKNVTCFTYFIYVTTYDLYLHSTDINKSGEEKFNTVSLRPLIDRKDREDVCGSVADSEAVQFIWDGMNEIIEKMDAMTIAKYGTQGFYSRDALRPLRYCYEQGKPEQYREYFTSICAVDVSFMREHYRKYALDKYGLEITDEEIENYEGEDFIQTLDYARELANKKEMADSARITCRFTDYELALIENYNRKKDKIKSQERIITEELKTLDELQKEAQEKSDQKRREYDEKHSKKRKVKEKKEKIKPVAKTKEKKIRSSDVGILHVFGVIFGGIALPFKGLFNWLKSVINDLTLFDFLVGLLPILLSITYVVLAATGAIRYISFAPNFKVSLFGYNFELFHLVEEMTEVRVENFFLKIGYGFLVLILFPISIILDLIVHLVFLIINIIWLIISIILSLCFLYVLPVAVPIWHIVYIFLTYSKRRAFAISCALISVACCISYFVLFSQLIH